VARCSEAGSTRQPPREEKEEEEEEEEKEEEFSHSMNTIKGPRAPGLGV
jgi:ribosomal protein L12E/L44/L45/RPP1/RPP2